jgi:hypothetical protein
MMPEWIIKILEGMGVPGAIIFVLMCVIGVLCGVIRVMYVQANKVYGYRLAERDSYKDALSNVSAVLADMLKATTDRNDLTQELGELIAKQSAAFELLKVTILAQYDNIKESNHAITQAVASQAHSLRELTSMVTDHRNVGPIQITDLKQAITASTQTIIVALRDALGQTTVIRRGGQVPRRPKSPP